MEQARIEEEQKRGRRDSRVEITEPPVDLRKLTVQDLAREMRERFRLQEQSIARMSGVNPISDAITRTEVAQILGGIQAGSKTRQSVVVGETSIINSGSGSVSIEYSTTTHVLRYSIDGGTTWTTIATAVAHS